MSLDLEAPDRRNLLDVRARLWQRRAAVLVGAGVSRAAAVPLHAGVAPLPLWDDLAARMRAALYDSPVAGPAPLRLAQEYEAAFGRPALVDLVARRVADEEHGPGPLHDRLLRLPWADVFTTNYDTLLERAARRVPDRYDPVYVPSDLGRQSAPRVVKLHGSLPSHLPLVLTEEDYRTYPDTRAPFAALVQTSLAEHAVVLLGFSYDDPNFLAWSGWARDRLGPHAPPVHLVGALDLPAHRRQLLEGRGVRPVDLAPLFPLERWPDADLRHRAALAWTLATLAAGEPPDPLDWLEARNGPSPSPLPAGCPPPLPGVPDRSGPVPAHPRSPRIAGATGPGEDLDAQRRAWRRERGAYPGWVVAPVVIQNQVARGVYGWGREIIGRAGDLPPVSRLGLLREYAWRHRVAGLLVSDEEGDLFGAALETVNPAPHHLDLADAEVDSAAGLPDGLEWADVLDDWTGLALAFLRHVRWAVDRERFDRWAGLLARLPLSAESEARLHYETCRMAIAELDRARAVEALRAWPKAPSAFLFGLTWRACVEGELDLWEEANETAGRSLARIHAAQASAREPDVALLSAEGWTRQFVAYAEQVQADQEGDYERMLSVDFSWQRELTRYGCNPADILSELAHGVKGTPPSPAPQERRSRKFDPGSYSTSWPLFGATHKRDDLEPGPRALLAAEEGGLSHASPPPFATTTLVTGGGMWTQIPSPAHALAVGLHVGADALADYFTRTRVAALSEGVVERLYDWVSVGVESGRAELERVSATGWSHPASRYLGPRLEALSRLAFRLDDDRREALVRLALSFLDDPVVQRDHSLHGPLDHLVRRGARHLAPERRAPLVVEALGAPVPQLDFDRQPLDKWPHLGLRFALDGVDLSGADVPPGLGGRLLRKLGETTPSVTSDRNARGRILWRLYVLHRNGLLTEPEESALAEAVWGGEDVVLDDPVGMWLAYRLQLPAPPGRDPVAIVRESATRDPDEPFSNMDLQRYALVSRWPAAPPSPDRLVEWTPEDAPALLSKTEAWFRKKREGESSESGPASFAASFAQPRMYPHVASPPRDRRCSSDRPRRQRHLEPDRPPGRRAPGRRRPDRPRGPVPPDTSGADRRGRRAAPSRRVCVPRPRAVRPGRMGAEALGGVGPSPRRGRLPSRSLPT